jgi:hypothetical protein
MLVREILKCQLRWRLSRRTARAESVSGLKHLVVEKGNWSISLPIANRTGLGYTFGFRVRVGGRMLGLFRFF